MTSSTVGAGFSRPMTGEEMVALSKKHTMFEWSAQGAVDPIPVARAKGVYFWTPEGKRFIDFNSQLMCVNIGHGERPRGEGHSSPGSGAAVRQSLYGHRAAGAVGRSWQRSAGRYRRVFFQRRAEANENAFKIARAVTGRKKYLARTGRIPRRDRRRRDHRDRRSRALDARRYQIVMCWTLPRDRAGCGLADEALDISKKSFSSKDRRTMPPSFSKTVRHQRPVP